MILRLFQPSQSNVDTQEDEEIEDAPTPPPVERKTRSSAKKMPSKKYLSS